MLGKAKDILGYSLLALDGEIGKSRDFLFDDHYWTIRYLVADTGQWLLGKRVLISPMSIREPNHPEHQLPVNLLKQQIEDAPSEREDIPVSRQFEVEFFKHYQWPFYWHGGYPWGALTTPEGINTQVESDEINSEVTEGDKHLRSLKKVAGYFIKASDGEIGHIEDFILDDETWAIKYLVVDTRNWLPGRKVLISPESAEKIDWARSTVTVGQSREQIKNSPSYEDLQFATPEHESRVLEFFKP